MDAQELRNLQEAYMEVVEGAAGDVAARAQKLANQRKGQTPKRKEMYQNLARLAAARERGPFKGGTTRTNMTPDDRDKWREADADHHSEFGERPGRNKHGKSTHGPGSLPKGKKFYRQVASGVADSATADPFRVLQSAAQQREHYDLYGIILSHLLDEGYAETPEAAESIMVNMSEDWRDSIIG